MNNSEEIHKLHKRRLSIRSSPTLQVRAEVFPSLFALARNEQTREGLSEIQQPLFFFIDFSRRRTTTFDHSIVSFILRCSTMENNFDQDLIYAIFKTVWSKKAIEREKNVDDEISKGELRFLSVYDFVVQEGAGTSKKNRPTSANSNAVKLSCEKLRLFVSEAVHRAATIAEAEGGNKIEATHLERILPQLLLDF
uniref:Centromere protein X n=1 Tax=Lactuca sativa TaxID=4236 RepID=A0A9R1W9F5_LACSA|nr:hypothetical protein LSAT_V11C300135710 [Lactuca sativa]